VLGPALVGAWIWAIYTPLVVMLARRVALIRERAATRLGGWILYGATHAAAVAVVAVFDAGAWAKVRPYIDGVTVPVDRVFAAILLTNIVSYLIVVSLTEAADFSTRWREREREAVSLARTADELRRQLDQARLRALETQLRPHFLYNTLNLAAELVYDEPQVADDMLTHLGALLRRSYRDSAQFVPLSEEMAFVRAYAEILTRRYRDRVRLTIDVPADLERHPVPAFLLQPLVENAFRHGVERRERTSAVDIEATDENGTLVMRVRDRELASVSRRVDRDADISDNGEPVDRPGEGIGLRNTLERLGLLYGGAAGLSLDRAPNETIASVWLPIAADLAGVALPPIVTAPAVREVAGAVSGA
jgi:LytS/YehU family sensor histidine kinase